MRTYGLERMCGELLRGMVCTAVAIASAACATFLPSSRNSGDGKVVTTDKGRCVDLVPESALHSVRACETMTMFTVVAVDRRMQADKAVFQSMLKEKLLQYLRPTPYPWRDLRRATVEIWVTAPLLSPRDASLVAVVLGGADGGNFAVRLPLEPESWSIDDDDVTLLGNDHYPTLAAKQAGVLAVQPRGHISGGRLAQFLGATGALTRTDLMPVGFVRRQPQSSASVAWQPMTLATRAFAESAVARLIIRHAEARDVIGEVQFVPAGEREGAKARVLTFAFGDGG